MMNGIDVALLMPPMSTLSLPDITICDQISQGIFAIAYALQRVEESSSEYTYKTVTIRIVLVESNRRANLCCFN